MSHWTSEKITSSLEMLTGNPRKRQFYAIDPYYREGWEDVETFAGRDRFYDYAPFVTALILRSDAIAVDGGSTIFRWLVDNGFKVHDYAIFKYTRILIREAWRYQLNIATRQRIDVMDMILKRCPSIYLLLSHPSPPCRGSVTTWLSSMKGSSAPEDRKATDLRAMIPGPQASVITYVHVPDEPADVVRDLGLFFGKKTRRRLINSIVGNNDASGSAESAVYKCEVRYGGQNLDFSDAIRAVRSQLGNLSPGSPLRIELKTLSDDLAKGKSRDWMRLLSLIDRTKLRLIPWQRVAIASVVAERHNSDNPIIPDIHSVSQ